jgi:hypothetical protein
MYQKIIDSCLKFRISVKHLLGLRVKKCVLTEKLVHLCWNLCVWMRGGILVFAGIGRNVVLPSEQWWVFVNQGVSEWVSECVSVVIVVSVRKSVSKWVSVVIVVSVRTSGSEWVSEWVCVCVLWLWWVFVNQGVSEWVSVVIVVSVRKSCDFERQLRAVKFRCWIVIGNNAIVSSVELLQFRFYSACQK